MSLLDGLAVALLPVNLLWALAGAALGTAVGVLPGVGPAMTVALLLPATFGLEPVSGMILLAGIYYGAMYGGSTTSILFNIPGESATIVTAIEGHAMTRSGRAGTALATAAIGSFVGGTVGTLLIAGIGPSLAQVALHMGPAEQFALIVLAFAMVTTVLGDNPWLGIASLCLGLLIGAVGIDVQTGEARLTFGVPQLLDGIDIIVVAVAFFAVAESLHLAWTGEHVATGPIAGGRARLTLDDVRRALPAWVRGLCIGFPLGAIPAGGAELPTLISYAVEKRLSRRPEEWSPGGPGAIEGVAGPEAANNASAAGTFVSLLALGIPTTATAAALLVALQQYGVQPGPLLFSNAGPLVWALLASLLVGNVMLVALNLPLAGWWARLAGLRPAYLHAGILVLATVGTWTLHRSAVDLAVLAALGAVGFAWRVLGCPAVPVVIGAMLGPLAEQHLQRALIVAQGDPVGVVTRPGAASLLSLAGLVVVGAVVVRRRRAIT